MAIKAKLVVIETGKEIEAEIVFRAGNAILSIVGPDGDGTEFLSVKVPAAGGKQTALSLLKAHSTRKGYRLEPR
jgi:hypothetical protein